MPDLVPEDRIKGKDRYLRDLQPGESIKVHPAAFSVTPERYLAILKSLQLDRPAFQLKTTNSSELGRDADGTWYVDLRNIDKDCRFDSISPKEMKRDRDSYLIIDKLLW